MNKKLVTGGIIAVAAISLITAGIIKASGSEGGSAVAVKTARIEKGTLSTFISADGIVEEVEKAEAYFDLTLKVKKVLIEEGMEVKKGQKLLELDTSELNSQLESLKVDRNKQKDALSSKALDMEVERAYNNLQAAERYYNDAKKSYEENKMLYEANAISKAELDAAEKALIEAESGVNGLKNAKLAYEAALENRESTRKSAADSLKLLDMQISNLEKKINAINERCVSPIDGIVAYVGVEEGAYTSNMQPAYKIINPDKLQVRAEVNEFDIKYVEVGQKVKITGDAIDKGTFVKGTVKSIAPVAITKTTAAGNETVVEILISIEGAGGILKPGLNVTCEIETQDKDDVLLAPMEAITPDKDDNMMVYVVDEVQKTLVQKKVKVGLSSDMQVEILEGLNEGDLVVLDPQPYYKESMRVKTVK